MSEDQSLEATPTSTTRNLQAYEDINTRKKLKKRMTYFLSSTHCYFTSYHNLVTITTTKKKMDMISIILPLLNLFILVLFWSWSLSTNQMEKGNQHKSNDSNYNPGYDQYMSLYLNPEDTHTKFWNTEPPMFSNTMDHLEESFIDISLKTSIICV
jgi:hypothetical protein